MIINIKYILDKLKNNNTDKKKEYIKKYKEDNKDKLNEKAKEYNEKHKCDTGEDGPIHTNYLGKTIFGPVGIRTTDVDNAGSIVQGILENGYYTCRIWVI